MNFKLPMKVYPFLLCILLFSAAAVSASKDFPIDKKTWTNQFVTFFPESFCKNDEWLKTCPKVSSDSCKKFFDSSMVYACQKKETIIFPIKNLSESLASGDKIGRCLGTLFDQKFPTKEKDKFTCRELLKKSTL
jgi:hypothetical protein